MAPISRGGLVKERVELCRTTLKSIGRVSSVSPGHNVNGGSALAGASEGPDKITILVPGTTDAGPIEVVFTPIRKQAHFSFRAVRIVGDGSRFLVVKIDKTVGKNANAELLEEFMKGVMDGGCTIQNKRYEWLGYTESNVKEHQFMLFEKRGDMSVKTLLMAVGKLKKVYKASGYGKYAARLGLSFSCTTQGPEIKDSETIQIREVTALDGSISSDGCGIIKASYAEKICTQLELAKDTCVFQFRHGGKKGTVVKYPDNVFEQIISSASVRPQPRPTQKKLPPVVPPLSSQSSTSSNCTTSSQSSQLSYNSSKSSIASFSFSPPLSTTSSLSAISSPGSSFSFTRNFPKPELQPIQTNSPLISRTNTELFSIAPADQSRLPPSPTKSSISTASSASSSAKTYSMTTASPTKESFNDPKAVLLAYRESMVKYSSNQNHFEISGISRPRGSSKLNVQFIILLMTLGIPLSVFEELLKEQLDKIAQFMTDRQTAISVLQSSDTGELDAEGAGFHQELFEMLLAGFDLREPYLRCRMGRFQKVRYDTLRKKLGIDVPNSVRAYGAMDETKNLLEDEVYLSLPHRTGVVLGKVAISRNPAYHPGDIRVFNAVNCAGLSHLHNVLVFSSNSSHSIPDMMGGGDLDGDEYWITWDPRLIPSEVVPYKDRTKPVKAMQVARPISNPSYMRSHTDDIDYLTSQTSSLTVCDDDDMKMHSSGDMSKDAITTFISARGGGVLGILSKQWTTVTPQLEGLALHPFAMDMTHLIESALDLLKSGTDPNRIRRKYEAIKQKHRFDIFNAEALPDDFFDQLRRMVPATVPKIIMEDFRPDPDILKEKSADKIIYDEEFRKAKTLAGKFGWDLKRAIEASNAEDEPKTPDGSQSKDYYSSWAESGSEAVVRKWKEEYFSGTTRLKKAQETIRAAAWYDYGYQNKKEVFSWLGARYLNTIKAEAVCGGRQPLPVGKLNAVLNPNAEST